MSLFLSLLFPSCVSVRLKRARLQGDGCPFEQRTMERYFQSSFGFYFVGY